MKKPLVNFDGRYLQPIPLTYKEGLGSVHLERVEFNGEDSVRVAIRHPLTGEVSAVMGWKAFRFFCRHMRESGPRIEDAPYGQCCGVRK
jgi:hypothetical protein